MDWDSPEMREALAKEQKKAELEQRMVELAPELRTILGIPSEVKEIHIRIMGYGKRRDGSYGWIYDESHKVDLQGGR
jgi:hypothetical protein